MAFSPRKNQNKSLDEMTPEELQSSDNTPPPDDYYSYTDSGYDGYESSSEDSNREPIYDFQEDNPSIQGQTSLENSAARTNEPASQPTGSRFTRNKPTYNNAPSDGARGAFSPASAARTNESSSQPTGSRFTRNKPTDNNSPSNGARGAFSPAFAARTNEPASQPTSSRFTRNKPTDNNNIPSNGENPQGVERFSRANHETFATRNNSNSSSYSANKNNDAKPTTASQALSNFKPASSPYPKSDPSPAYVAKRDNKDMNMRVQNIHGIKTANPQPYNPEKLVLLTKSFNQPAQPSQSDEQKFYEQNIPARANAGFNDDLEIPAASTTPKKAFSSNSNKAFLNKGNQQQQKEFQSQISKKPQYEPIKNDIEEATELFETNKNTVESDSSKIIKTTRFKSIQTLIVENPPRPLEEAFLEKISQIDSLQSEIIENYKRLNPHVNIEEVLAKKSKSKKSKAKSATEQLENPTEQSEEGSSVEAKKITRTKNKDFVPKSTANAANFQDIGTPQFEGENLSDLEKSSVSTKELLNISTIQLSPGVKFNTQELSAIPPESLLSFLGAEKIEEDNKTYYQLGVNVFDVSSGSNKWFNTILKKGSSGTINLMKHLIAIENNIIENENNSDLFKAACIKLMTYLPEINEFISNSNADLEAKKQLETQAFFRAIDMIPLEDIMVFLGARNNHKGARGRWKVPQNGHVYSISQGWRSFTSSEHGNGAIRLFAHAIAEQEGLYYDNPSDFKKLFKIAVNTLKSAFEQEIKLNINLDFDNFEYKTSFHETFYMPIVIPFKQHSVANYLHQKRGLPMWVINKQFASGLLYPGFPSDWERPKEIQFNDTLEDKNVWAVFLGANANSAELRAIDRYDGTAKLQAKGATKEHGGHVVKAEKDFQEYTVCSFEAAIDALSYHALHPGRTTNSCMGVNYALATKIAIEALDNDYNYNLCFDNDLAGNLNTLKFKEELIHNIGEEDYLNFYQNDKITYFELGIHCYNEQVLKGQPYYLDVSYNEDGKKIFKMFSQELLKFFEKEDIFNDMRNGLFYIYNITPDVELIRHNDIEEAAKKTANYFLNENKPFYFVTAKPTLSISNYDTPEEIKSKTLEHEVNLVKHQAFMEFFKVALGEEKWNELEERGAIIPNIKTYAKDWNEFIINEQANKPEVASIFKEREEYFKNIYTEDVKIAEVAGKIRRKP